MKKANLALIVLCVFSLINVAISGGALRIILPEVSELGSTVPVEGELLWDASDEKLKVVDSNGTQNTVGPIDGVKCQVKVLTSNFAPTSVSTNSDTNFSNLTIGKMYKVCAQIRVDGTYTGSDNLGVGIKQPNTIGTLARVLVNKDSSSDRIIARGCTFLFEAAQTNVTVEFEAVSSGNYYSGASSVNGDKTYVELCEYSNNYSLTTEW